MTTPTEHPTLRAVQNFDSDSPCPPRALCPGLEQLITDMAVVIRYQDRQYGAALQSTESLRALELRLEGVEDAMRVLATGQARLAEAVEALLARQP